MEMHPIQAAFLDRTAMVAGFVGGRGTGKTTIGAYDLLRRAIPGRHYMVVAPTYTMLEDASLVTFETLARKFGYLKKLNRASMVATLGNNAKVLFRSADNPDRLRGPNLSGVWIDEASQVSRDAYDIVLACLREDREHGWLTATFTPKGLTHWTYNVFAKGGDGVDLFFAKTYENPFLPESLYHTLIHQYAGLRAEQELQGRFVAIEGAEWPAEFFGPQIWFDDWPPESATIAKGIGLDPSKGKDAKHGDYSAFVNLAVTNDGTAWVDADMRNDRNSTLIVDTGMELCRVWQPHCFAVETNQFQELLAVDFRRVAVERGLTLPLHEVDNRVNKQVRIRRLTPWLSQGKLRFKAGSPGARLLVEQLRDFPFGEHDDGPDALEMILRKLAEGPGVETITGQVGASR